jgi:hypothetical protein
VDRFHENQSDRRLELELTDLIQDEVDRCVRMIGKFCPAAAWMPALLSAQRSQSIYPLTDDLRKGGRVV